LRSIFVGLSPEQDRGILFLFCTFEEQYSSHRSKWVMMNLSQEYPG